MPNNVTVDLTELAALHPRADELSVRITAGDVAACFDADEFLADVERVTADARAFVKSRDSVHVQGGDVDFAASVANDAADGLVYVIAHLTGSFELQAVLDDARADSEPDG